MPTPHNAHGLYGAFSVKGGVMHTIFLRLVRSFFCSTRAASILPPRPRIANAVARSEDQGRRASLAPPKALSLTLASTAANCPVIGWFVWCEMIRGEPAIGHEQSPQTTLVFG